MNGVGRYENASYNQSRLILVVLHVHSEESFFLHQTTLLSI
jgi:hypothetical protein